MGRPRDQAPSPVRKILWRARQCDRAIAIHGEAAIVITEFGDLEHGSPPPARIRLRFRFAPLVHEIDDEGAAPGDDDIRVLSHPSIGRQRPQLGEDMLHLMGPVRRIGRAVHQQTLLGIGHQPPSAMPEKRLRPFAGRVDHLRPRRPVDQIVAVGGVNRLAR